MPHWNTTDWVAKITEIDILRFPELEPKTNMPAGLAFIKASLLSLQLVAFSLWPHLAFALCTCPGGHSSILAWRIPGTEEPGGL